jgi:homoserine O-acetyltransferase
MLTKTMDSHHLGRGDMNASEKLSQIKSRCLVIGISSDLLFPVSEQEFIAANIKNANLEIIESIYGHDGFLLEDDTISRLLKNLTT